MAVERETGLHRQKKSRADAAELAGELVQLARSSACRPTCLPSASQVIRCFRARTASFVQLFSGGGGTPTTSWLGLGDY